MEHLKKQNEELGRLIHKDNKLIPALETAGTDFLSADGDEKNKALGASLILQLKELSGSRREYEKVQDAVETVRLTGYGVITPNQEEIQLAEPEIIKQGSKYGVKIKAASPSIHLIRADIETEIAPIVGTESQARDLMEFIKASSDEQNGIWKTNIFGKSVEQLVTDGIRGKLSMIGEESQRKLQDTMGRIVNESNGGLICIII